MKKQVYLDNTQPVCWGYCPDPENHTAFVGWRAILERVNGKLRLDYVPGRGSSKGLKTDCDKLVKWWSKGKDCPEKWWLKNYAKSTEEKILYGPVASRKLFGENGHVRAVVRRSDDYVYISLYLDRKERMKIEDMEIGLRVQWHDPDDEACSCEGTVVSFCEEDEVVLIKRADGVECEVYPCELEKLKKHGTQEYTVSMRVDGRVDVIVEVSSFEEAFEKAQNEEYDPTEVNCIEFVPVNATNEKGELKDY